MQFLTFSIPWEACLRSLFFHIPLLNYTLSITTFSSIDLRSFNLLFLITSFIPFMSPSPFPKAHLMNTDRSENPKNRTPKRIHSSLTHTLILINQITIRVSLLFQAFCSCWTPSPATSSPPGSPMLERPSGDPNSLLKAGWARRSDQVIRVFRSQWIVSLLSTPIANLQPRAL